MTGRPKGWWRRNWWGLLAVLPVLVALLAIHPNQPYQQWRQAEPRTAVTAGGDGWVAYGGARLQLAELAPAVLVDRAGEPFPLPAGVAAWQATVVIAPGPDPDVLAGCRFRLEDGQGRQFSNDPNLLRDARLPDQGFFIDGRCTPEDDDAAAETFSTVVMFALPAAAEPAALRVTLPRELPRYALLSVG